MQNIKMHREMEAFPITTVPIKKETHFQPQKGDFHPKAGVCWEFLFYFGNYEV